MKRIDVMVDLETLGLGTESLVFQIGAVAFDITTGMILDNFDYTIDISTSTNKNVELTTIKWWLDTDSNLMKDLLCSDWAENELDVWKDFAIWLDGVGNEGEVHLWGNGIAFDNVKVDYNFERLGITNPIEFYNYRDVRTVLDLASIKAGVSPSTIKDSCKPSTMKKHNAIDDAHFQMCYVIKCYNILMS